jgi:hypothetical protein
MPPITLHLRIRLSQDEDLYLILRSLRPGSILCLAARTAGKGTIIRNPPKGWTIRRDPQDDAFEGQPKHYHCEKDGEEIVITHDGYGSHDTKSGERIPKTLGDFLEKRLGIPVNKNDQGRHVIRLEVQRPWYPYHERESVEILNELLNYWSVIDVETDEDNRNL